MEQTYHTVSYRGWSYPSPRRRPWNKHITPCLTGGGATPVHEGGRGTNRPPRVLQGVELPHSTKEAVEQTDHTVSYRGWSYPSPRRRPWNKQITPCLTGGGATPVHEGGRGTNISHRVLQGVELPQSTMEAVEQTYHTVSYRGWSYPSPRRRPWNKQITPCLTGGGAITVHEGGRGTNRSHRVLQGVELPQSTKEAVEQTDHTVSYREWSYPSPRRRPRNKQITPCLTGGGATPVHEGGCGTNISHRVLQRVELPQSTKEAVEQTYHTVSYRGLRYPSPRRRPWNKHITPCLTGGGATPVHEGGRGTIRSPRVLQGVELPQSTKEAVEQTDHHVSYRGWSYPSPRRRPWNKQITPCLTGGGATPVHEGGRETNRSPRVLQGVELPQSTKEAVEQTDHPVSYRG